MTEHDQRARRLLRRDPRTHAPAERAPHQCHALCTGSQSFIACPAHVLQLPPGRALEYEIGRATIPDCASRAAMACTIGCSLVPP